MNNINEIKQLISEGRSTIVLVLADWCTNCNNLKPELPGIKALANYYDINLMTISATDKENEEFLKENQFETLPYCLVFVNNEFKGGESASKEMLEQLIPVLAGAIKRDSVA